MNLFCNTKIMKKIIFFGMGVAIAMTSCKSDAAKEDATVCVHIKMHAGNIETATRATASDAGVTSISFAVFNADGNKEVDVTQYETIGGDLFGTMDFEVQEGTYTFVAEGHNISGASNLSKEGKALLVTLPGDIVHETFCATKNVTVAAGDDIDVDMTLKRVTAQFKLVTIDNQPTGVREIKFTIGDATKEAYTSYAFDASTGTMDEFGVNGKMVRSWTLVDREAGAPTEKTFDLLLGAAEQDLPVTIDILDGAGNVLYTHTISSVPFKQNSKTIITGVLYATEGSGTFQIDTEWNEDIDGGW